MTKPLLSFGIIFKNEIRCLERCLKSLQPLRNMVPMEIVMADTGSDDGSREVAEKYADILFDFPWINDFAAARNAVMDRCSGDWFFSIDCDEWLGEDTSELAEFVKDDGGFKGNAVSMPIYNYTTPELDENHAEFIVFRLFRMSSGLRFEGAIHERCPYERSGCPDGHHFSKVILHHDGYVELNKEEGEAKRKRNLAPLRKMLKQDPENLRTLTQYLESGKPELDYLDQLRRAMKIVRNKRSEWRAFGASIFRYAVIAAKERGLSELNEWIQEAKKRFPNSPFTRIDVEYIEFVQAWDEKNYSRCILIGERCLAAMVDLREGRIDREALMYGALLMQGAHWEQELKTFLAEAYLRENQPQKCREYLERLDYKYLNRSQTKRMLCTMLDLHIQSKEDTAPLVKATWAGIQEPVPSKERADERRCTFLEEASIAFTKSSMDGERPAYTLFVPLVGECEVGNAAYVMELENPVALEQALAQVEHWNEFPIAALAHALECGAEFPQPGRPLNIEEMDDLAGRLTQDRGVFLKLALRTAREAEAGDQRGLLWARGLLLAAVQSYPWTDDQGNGLALARAFAEIERKFLPNCYTPAVLWPEGLYALPPMHRFGWYCAQAFDTLDAGDAAGYVRLLREGLTVCESVKDMVEFLVDHTPALKAPSDELKMLAEQVRGILNQFAPDDPAVAVLKQSEAYQKVASLIEGAEPPVVGGLRQ